MHFILIVIILKVFNLILNVISFSFNPQTPYRPFMNPALWNVDVMFSALHVVNNNKWDIFSFTLYFYVKMVQYCYF